MASQEKIVPVPLVAATTLLPKRPLSFRWAITNAEVFLENKSEPLKSPTFTITLPLRTESEDHQHQTVTWYLTAQNVYNSSNIYLCQAKSPNAIPDGKSHKIVVSECTLSFIDSQMRAALHKDLGCATCDVHAPKDTQVCCLYSSSYSSYIYNGTLTIQVNATLLCYTDQVDKLEEECTLQLDNLTAGMKCLLQDKLFSDVTIK